MKLYFEGSQTIVQDDNKELRLEYYLVEEDKQEWDQVAYGIQVVQYVNESSCYEYTQPISYDKSLVETMVHKLKENTVTVSTVLEIVDDMVSEY